MLSSISPPKLPQLGNLLLLLELLITAYTGLHLFIPCIWGEREWENWWNKQSERERDLVKKKRRNESGKGGGVEKTRREYSNFFIRGVDKDDHPLPNKKEGERDGRVEVIKVFGRRKKRLKKKRQIGCERDWSGRLRGRVRNGRVSQSVFFPVSK